MSLDPTAVGNQTEIDISQSAQPASAKPGAGSCSQRWFVDSRWFNIFMSLLTAWVIFSPDLRLAATSKPADMWFNLITMMCLVGFIVELIVTSLGKPGYLPRAFFWLDIFAVIEAVLDLTWISDSIVADDGPGGSSGLGAAVLFGARLWRLVLFLPCPGMSRASPERETEKRQTRYIGVIIMTGILFTLLMPLFAPDEAHTKAAAYAVDEVQASFASWHDAWSSAPSSSATSDLRVKYEYQLLDFLLYQSLISHERLFWIGVKGSRMDSLVSQVPITVVDIEAWTASSKTNTVLHEAYKEDGGSNDIELANLGKEWATLCNAGSSTLTGVSLIADGVDGHVTCPEELRAVERRKYAARMLTKEEYEEFHFVIYEDIRPHLQTAALLSLARSFVICSILGCATWCVSHVEKPTTGRYCYAVL